MDFAAAIAYGLAKATSAMGVSFTLDGGPTLRGVVDRRADVTKPADGGLSLDWDATLLVPVAALTQSQLLDPAGDAILDTSGSPLLDDVGLSIGRKLTVLGQQMRIVALEYDGHQFNARLANVNQ